MTPEQEALLHRDEVQLAKHGHITEVFGNMRCSFRVSYAPNLGQPSVSILTPSWGGEQGGDEGDILYIVGAASRALLRLKELQELHRKRKQRLAAEQLLRDGQYP